MGNDHEVAFVNFYARGISVGTYTYFHAKLKKLSWYTYRYLGISSLFLVFLNSPMMFIRVELINIIGLTQLDCDDAHFLIFYVYLPDLI